ncbi:NUDIX hydrolase [bacterium]|nr:NUDIX hydrolase [bacterium]
MARNAKPACAVVAIISQGDRLLVIKRSATVRSPNLFCFPGGMIEVGETPEIALHREMSEELNICAEAVSEVWQSYTPKGTRLHWWTAKSNELERVFPNPDEVASFEFMTLEEIFQMKDVLESNQVFFEAIRAGELAKERLFC